MEKRDIPERYSKFKGHFHLPNDDFLEPVDYVDAFGFSTLKKYHNNYVSIFGILISEKYLRAEGLLKPLLIHASYGKQTDRGVVTESSSEKIRGLSDPIDLVSSDDFFYNFETDTFYHKSREVTADSILKYIDESHRKPTRLLRGSWLRIKLIFWRIIARWAVMILSNLLVSTLNLITGARISSKIWNRVVFPDRMEEEMNSPKITDGAKIDFFGYKASTRLIIVYCYLHLFIFLMFFLYDYRPDLLAEISKSNFLTIIYIITSVSIFESILPKLLKFLVKKSSMAFQRVVNTRIEI